MRDDPMTEPLDRHRTLTDDDITAIVDAARERMVRDVYQAMGRGLFGAAWKMLLTLALALAAYGGFTEHRP
jgi:hypothetical protein